MSIFLVSALIILGLLVLDFDLVDIAILGVIIFGLYSCITDDFVVITVGEPTEQVEGIPPQEPYKQDNIKRDGWY